MNVTFVLPSEELNKICAPRPAAGLVNLKKGHRSVGGIRASIYNAMPVEGRPGAGAVHESLNAKKRVRRKR